MKAANFVGPDYAGSYSAAAFKQAHFSAPHALQAGCNKESLIAAGFIKSHVQSLPNPPRTFVPSMRVRKGEQSSGVQLR